MNWILGISAFYHDSAATLLRDGKVFCAFQEERFSRVKQDKRFPRHAIRACLDFAGLTLRDIETICYYEDPPSKYNRIVSTYFRHFPKGTMLFAKEFPRYRAHKQLLAAMSRQLETEFGDGAAPVRASEHHLSHAASAYYPSPFSSAAVLCVDGVGEWATVSAWHGKGNRLVPLWTIDFPHSLGLLYSAFTYFCGFKVDSGEYKLMGLAPYGEPVYADRIEREIIDLRDDGSFRLNPRYFDYETGARMTSPAFDRLFGGPRREPEGPITQREMDLAASIQLVTEKVMSALVARIRRDTGERNLCLAGGVALNCVANGKLLKEAHFDHLFVQPASGDAGGSMGAAFVGHFAAHPEAEKFSADDRSQDDLQGSYLGNEYSDAEICRHLDALGARYEVLNEVELVARTGRAIADDKVIGWFQGRMEFGPRALGARSILGNPCSHYMQRTMNLKIKYRESFRPFAPAILAEHAGDWFDLDTVSPYMLIVAGLRNDRRKALDARDAARVGLDKVNAVRADIPAVIHVDYSARIQTVDGHHNNRFRRLLEDFHARTGCPIVINTSFNVRGEPIVESPRDAFTCFMRTGMDCLVIGSAFLEKKAQAAWNEKIDWRVQFELD
ncbi:carbamoyltransferase [Dyella flava]|uniref:Carbamoyltransferase n=1 Tax=Dyella flava TaxID=1920170 RepID=A0ABS2K6D6_9GAMM|nr:carbamoyltransferase [Dyella flava]MBM7126767.1 carbamoyltransferase [Dyella flava]GLQ49410.1 nodulation protein [Dyella flava]